MCHHVGKHMQSASGQSGIKLPKKIKENAKTFAVYINQVPFVYRVQVGTTIIAVCVICSHLLWAFTLLLFFFI